MRVFIISAFILLTQLGFAQQVVNISFEGLARTQADALQSLLLPMLGDTFSEQVLQSNLKRLSNWPAAYHIGAEIDTLENGNYEIRYQLREGVSRYPTAFVGGLENNFWWEIGYQDINWHGRGNTFTAALRRTDGLWGGRISYDHRFLRQALRWGVRGQFERFVSQEPLYFGAEQRQVDYFYTNHNLSATLSHYLKPQQRFELGAIYFREEYEKVDTEIELGPNAQQEDKFLGRVGYIHNQVFFHPTQPTGQSWQASTEVVWQDSDPLPFLLFRASWNRYMPTSEKGMLAWRITAGLASNRATPFAPFVVDSRLNIRGAGNRVDRGTGAIILNFEYRQMLLERPHWAIQGVAFSDVGTWRSPGGSLEQFIETSSLKYFMGLGGRLFLGKYRQFSLRLDYGWGVQPIGRRGVVLGLGQYF